MRVFRSAEGLPPIKFPVVTVGSYDGVHFGHRALLEQVKTMADEASLSGPIREGCCPTGAE